MERNQPLGRDYKVWLPLLFTAVLVLGMFAGMRIQELSPASNQSDFQVRSPTNHTEYGKLEELIRYIEAKYVDSVDRQELIDKAIKEVLSQLDPHSTYIPVAQMRDVSEQLEGNFEGIGVEFLMLDDTIVVVAALSGGPSETAGVLAGDKIVQIEDSLVVGKKLSTTDIMERLRGPKGTDVRIGVLRKGAPEPVQLQITRDKIPVHSLDAAYMLNETTGYIKLNRFSATTYEEFMKALERLVEKEGMLHLVIDVRQNPGGYLPETTRILSQLFKENRQLLVYTEGRSSSRNDYESTGRPFFNVGDIAVLIDEGSASASEILAGAIQDHDRGVVVGRRSFGKGLVQEQYSFRDGSALRLTVARYYTPSGRLIQKPYADKEAYQNDINNRYESGELLSADSIRQIDSVRYYTDYGREVFAGGGITPDVFVAMDTMLLNRDFVRLRQLIPQFIFRYLDEEPIPANRWTLKEFRKSYQVSDALYQRFLDFAWEKDARIDRTEDLSRLKTYLKLQLKARIAKVLFDNEGLYAVLNDADADVKAALKAMESGEYNK
jgi:carboxyl-terminal processing protease